SGVGKSTLTNQLLGDNRQAVQTVRTDDSRGRHTTTQRELFPLPSGGLLIDTPGMRELQLWQTETGLTHTFADIEEIAQQCRFRDCQHETEPGCMVQAAIDEGIISRKRWRSYQKLQREQQYTASRHDYKAQLEEKRKWKRIHKEIRKRSR
ncbi:MAG: ribosome small subunit-dependent GTPase A, partial [Kamptonema sp. SIO4C4]|nr:ribosome small subunit-dependent GTPase A [Kamptonema sp. SIO4C4]